MTDLVVAADFSEPSRKAFDAAIRLAKDLGAHLVLVHATEPMPLGGRRDPISAVRAEVDEEEWRVVCDSWAADARRQVPVETVARPGRPADVVLAVARERDAPLVVVGSHGRTGIKRAVLGSVADAIVRQSHVPVVVVPA